MSNHLSHQQMLAYVDGELSWSDHRKAETHLHSCWRCLAELERLKSDIATILEAQNESFIPALPPPPQPWAGIDTLIARSGENEASSLWSRFTAQVSVWLTPSHFAAIATAVIAILIVTHAKPHAGSLSAQQVLQHVRAADLQRSTISRSQVIHERIRLRSVARKTRRERSEHFDTWKSPTAAYWKTKSDSAAADLKAQYLAHNIPVGLPLSIESVESWGKAAGGAGTLTREGNNLNLSFAQEKPTESIEKVSLIIEPRTWHVTQMTLELRDTSFELSEENYQVMPESEVPNALIAYLELPAVGAPKLASDVPVNAIHLPGINLDTAELDAYSAIHALKADLGEPVAVTRNAHSVQVGVWQLPEERQKEITAALSGRPGIQVQLTEPRVLRTVVRDGPVSEARPVSEGPIHVDAEDRQDDQRLLKYFRSAEREQDFTNEAIGTSTVILSHLYALQNLQREFPTQRIASLDAENQSRLRDLVQDHVTSIAANADALDRQLAPLNASFNVGACVSSGGDVTANWQQRAVSSLIAAKEMDHLLRTMLTTNEMPTSPVTALPRINQNLCELRDKMSDMTRTDDSLNIH